MQANSQVILICHHPQLIIFKQNPIIGQSLRPRYSCKRRSKSANMKRWRTTEFTSRKSIEQGHVRSVVDILHHTSAMEARVKFSQRFARRANVFVDIVGDMCGIEIMHSTYKESTGQQPSNEERLHCHCHFIVFVTERHDYNWRLRARNGLFHPGSCCVATRAS